MTIMETSKIFKKQLSEGKLNDELIGEVLFSYSKRAKNMRDKAIEYEYYRWHNKYTWDNIANCHDKMDLYYSRKAKILRMWGVKPKCVHKAIYEDGDYQLFNFYEVGNHTFHQPIKKPNGLPIVELKDGLYVDGEDTNELLSVQFCEKVFEFLLKKTE